MLELFPRYPAPVQGTYRIQIPLCFGFHAGNPLRVELIGGGKRVRVRERFVKRLLFLLPHVKYCALLHKLAKRLLQPLPAGFYLRA